MKTLCNRECKRHKEMCVGCLRTMDEIRNWRNTSVEDRVKLMKQIQGQTSTHTCPECQGPAYCAMEAGKSSNLCWCMSVTRDENPSIGDMTGACLCRKCLTKT